MMRGGATMLAAAPRPVASSFATTLRVPGVGTSAVAAALVTTTVDSVVFGNASSESAHGLTAVSSQVVVGGLGQTARQFLPLTTPGVNGGSTTFTIAVDPNKRNYFTVKLWGSDDTDQGKGRLQLYVPAGGKNYQVGYRHEGDYLPLSVTAAKPALAGRFMYSTTLLPLSFTKGKTSITLTIQSTGELYGLGSGGPPTGTYQLAMDTPSRGLYRAYTHTQAMLDVGGETQGVAPVATTAPAVNADALLGPTGTFTNGVNGWVTSTLARPTGVDSTFSAGDIENLARAYVNPHVTNAYNNNAVVTKLVDAIDGFATDYFADPTNSVKATTYGRGVTNEQWGGRFGWIGWAIKVMAGVPSFQSQLDVTANYGTAGGDKTRRVAWGAMLKASRDYGRFSRDNFPVTNRLMYGDSNIYKANAGMLALGTGGAFADTVAQRYLKESCGLLPFLGSDLSSGGSSLKHGSDYYIMTPDGMTREYGYAGGYAELSALVAEFGGMSGNPAFTQQAVKMVRALAYFKKPSIEVVGSNNYRSMQREGVLAWRGVREADGYVANDISYAGEDKFSVGMAVAAASLDPAVVGYAKQMLADNWYLETLTTDSRFFKSLGSEAAMGVWGVWDDYNTVVNAPDSGVRLPLTPGQPDFAWADEVNGVGVIKTGNTSLYFEPYWSAQLAVGINGLSKFEYDTPAYKQYGIIETNVQYASDGAYLSRTNNVDVPKVTLFAPPDNPSQAYAGSENGIAASPTDNHDEEPFMGKADFYGLRFGNYLFGMNRTSDKAFALKTPVGFASAVDRFTGTTKSGAITVAPGTTVALQLPDTFDALPVPTAPLVLKAVGVTGQVVLNWQATSDASSYNVKRATFPDGPYTVVGTPTGTTFTDTTVTPGATYTYVVTGINANGESYDSPRQSVSAGLPTGWTSRDIGTVSLPGSAKYVDNAFTVLGTGSDVGGSADSFQFTSTSLGGDGSIVARVANTLNTNYLDEVGLMIRDGIAANAVNVAAVLTNDTGTVALTRRTTAGGSTSTAGSKTYFGTPYWMRLARAGNVFTAAISPDATTWTTVSTATVAMGATVQAGLFVCSRYAAETNVTTFDNVTVAGVPPVVSPSAPTGLSAQAVSTRGVQLSWTDTASTETGFAIDVALNGAFTGAVDTRTAPANATSALVTGLAPGTSYYFRVRAVNAAGVSSDSNIATAGTRLPADAVDVADTFVRDQVAEPDHGTDTTLQTKTSGSGFNRVAYLKFDLATVDPSAVTVALRLRAGINGTPETSITAGVYAVADTAWSESGMTNANKPTLGAQLGSFVAGVTNAVVTVDLTTAVKAAIDAGQRFFALAIRNTTSSAATLTINSREAAVDAPVLVVTEPDTSRPSLVSAASRKTQGSAGTFDLPLSLDAATTSVEPRLGGVTTLVLTFDEPVLAADGVLDASEFAIANATFAGVSVDGDRLLLQLADAANRATLTVRPQGLTDASGNAMLSGVSVAMRTLAGDVDQTGAVNVIDQARAKAALAQPVGVINFLNDVNNDGLINVIDQALIKSYLSQTV